MNIQIINSMFLSTKIKIDILKTGIVKLLLISTLCGVALCGSVLFSATLLAEIASTDFAPISSLLSGFAFTVSFMVILFLGLPLFSETLLSTIVAKIYKALNNVQFVFLLLVVLAGNLLGIFFVSLFTLGTGLLTDEVGYYLVTLASEKLTTGFFETFFSSLISALLLSLMFFAFYMPKENQSRMLFVFLTGLLKFSIVGETTLLNVPTFLLAGLSPFSEGVLSLGSMFLHIFSSTLGNVLILVATAFFIKLLFYKKATPPEATSSAKQA